MNRHLAISALSAALLAGCVTAPKLPALPPPAEDATPPAAGQPAPARWYEPLVTDDATPRGRKGGGVLWARYPWLEETKEIKMDVDYTSTITAKVQPLAATLKGAYVNQQVGFYGVAVGRTTLKFDSATTGRVEVPITVWGLHEGVRVPIALLDLKKQDIQLFLVPGITMQVLVMNGEGKSGWKSDIGLIAGGSLNGAGLGLSIGGSFMVELDLWKVGWTYFMINLTNPADQMVSGSLSGWSAGFAPAIFARGMF